MGLWPATGWVCTAVGSLPSQGIVCLTSCLFCGDGISWMPCSLAGSGLRPSLETVWPMKDTSEQRSFSFCLFIMIPLSRQLWNSARSFVSWSLSVSASVLPTTYTSMSLKIGLTPFRPSKALSNLLWNSSQERLKLQKACESICTCPRGSKTW